MHSGPMPIASVIIIILGLIGSTAGLIFCGSIYRDVWLASSPKIDFSPLCITPVPLVAIFLITTFEVYFRNIAKQESPAWLLTATKYILIGAVLALVVGPIVTGLAARSHLTAAGYVRTYDSYKSPDRGLWQKWEKVQDRGINHTDNAARFKDLDN